MQRFEVMTDTFWAHDATAGHTELFCRVIVFSYIFARVIPTHLNSYNLPCLPQNQEPTQPDPRPTRTSSEVETAIVGTVAVRTTTVGIAPYTPRKTLYRSNEVCQQGERQKKETERKYMIVCS